MSESTHKRIAKNTIALYFRTLFGVVISLYTSRIVLNALGVSDYGIYTVAASVVGMLGFLNASMAGATSRFLTFEMGKSNFERLRQTFSNAFILHLLIAGIVFFVAETVGLWLLGHKLVIAPDKMAQAHVVYQFSIVSALITITQVPYNACLIAREHMTVFAYIDILNTVLKLLIVYLTLFAPQEMRLVAYAGLVLAVSVLTAMVYRVYCMKQFQECRIEWKVRQNIIKPMLTFCGWDFFGNMSVTVNFQGYGIALNLLYGTVMNAAYGIANTVQGILKGLALNIVIAFRPQIIKLYAQSDVSAMSNMIYSATKLSLTLYLVLAMPLYVEIDTVLALWLGMIPAYASIILRIILISGVLNVANIVLNIPIHATGKLGVFSFCTGIFYFISPFVFYAITKWGVPIQWSFHTVVFINMCTFIVTLICLKWQVRKFSIRNLFSRCYLPILIPCVIFSLLIFQFSYTEGIPRLLLFSTISMIVWGVFGLFYALNASQRQQLFAKFKKH